MPHWVTIMDGHYEISDRGDVRRITGGKGATPKRVLRQCLKDGYPVLSLSVGGLPRRHYVHRLVAAAFIGPCPDGYYVNHVDGDRANTAASNLEYVNASENGHHAVGIGRTPSGESHGAAKVTESDVRTIRAKFAQGVRQADLCRLYGLAPGTMHHIVHGITWKGSL